ncbi:MAG: hypothetical protein Q9214_001892 [Letrouitia sp. 1 TL-2023]
MDSGKDQEFSKENWGELDEAAWQKIWEEMEAMDEANIELSPDQAWSFEPTFTQGPNDFVPNDVGRSAAITNDTAQSDGPLSPPDYATLSSQEATPDAEPVPRTEASAGKKPSDGDLKGLIDQLQRELEIREMPYNQWDDYETAIVVYFASRHASHDACRQILDLKCAGKHAEPRTVISVRSKLDAIRKIEGLWSDRQGWNRIAVDNWLISLRLPELQAAVGVGKEELSMIAEENRTEFLSAVLSPSVLTKTTDQKLFATSQEEKRKDT